MRIIRKKSIGSGKKSANNNNTKRIVKLIEIQILRKKILHVKNVQMMLKKLYNW